MGEWTHPFGYRLDASGSGAHTGLSRAGPDSVFAERWRVRLLEFQLLAAAGRDGEAAKVFEVPAIPPTSPLWVLGMLERGRIAERRSQRETDAGTRGTERTRAAECFQFMADVWRHADLKLQGYVTEAREALAGLAKEERP